MYIIVLHFYATGSTLLLRIVSSPHVPKFLFMDNMSGEEIHGQRCIYRRYLTVRLNLHGDYNITEIICRLNFCGRQIWVRGRTIIKFSKGLTFALILLGNRETAKITPSWKIPAIWYTTFYRVGGQKAITCGFIALLTRATDTPGCKQTRAKVAVCSDAT